MPRINFQIAIDLLEYTEPENQSSISWKFYGHGTYVIKKLFLSHYQRLNNELSMELKLL